MYRLPNSSLSLHRCIWVSSGLTPLPSPVVQQLSVLKDPLKCSLNRRFSRNISHTRHVKDFEWALLYLCKCLCMCMCVCECMQLLLTVKAHLAVMLWWLPLHPLQCPCPQWAICQPVPMWSPHHLQRPAGPCGPQSGWGWWRREGVSRVATSHLQPPVWAASDGEGVLPAQGKVCSTHCKCTCHSITHSLIHFEGTYSHTLCAVIELVQGTYIENKCIIVFPLFYCPLL